MTMKEKYCFNIPKGGSQALNILDYCFNESTAAFLLNVGLAKGMKVLELGCGSGKMSAFIAKQIGDEGHLIAVDNNQNQLDAAIKHADAEGITNIDFKCLDAYDISQLNTQFDMVYCRFILHHLKKPRAVIHDFYKLLKPGGIAAIEEGIVNHAFTYPYNIAFGNERFDISDHHDNFEGKQRDGNFGIKLYHSLYQAGFKSLTLNIIAPTLTTKTEKMMLKPGFINSKQSAIENGLTEDAWQEKLTQLEKHIEDESSIIGFYQSAQVSGVKQDQ